MKPTGGYRRLFCGEPSFSRPDARDLSLDEIETRTRHLQRTFEFLDEAARLPNDVIDAIKPTVAVRRGDWWMASTPRGRRGRFFEAWSYGPDFLKISAPASDNPRIAPEFVDECRREHGEDYVRQEFECKFLESGVNLMAVDQVDRLVRGTH